ncbi:hypothetical protein [Streptomyces cyaneofuscatus]|uniref:hypothetical protein n=1 Tax=Streptomyces cyaneofuscatus TaxID=66883 RepID=UPI003418C74A
MTRHGLLSTSTTLTLATLTIGLAIAGVPSSATAAPSAVTAAATAGPIDPDILALPRWMDQVSDVIGDRPLNKIVMPGSHDAGSWSITDKSGVCDTASEAKLAREHPQIAAAISITQMSPIKEQLNAGSRYLDLRLCKKDGKWFTYHGGPLGGLFFDDPATGRKGEIDQITEWIRNHPEEIVTIELRTSAPNDDPGANSEAVRLLGEAIGTARIADKNKLSPTSTYNQFMAAGANVVLLDAKATTNQPWAWMGDRPHPDSRVESRNSYVENKDWGGLIKEALANPFRQNPAIDKISRTAIDRMQKVLTTDSGDPRKLFTLSGNVDSTLAIPDAVNDVVSHGMNYKPDGMPYMLYLAREHNTRLLEKLEGEWRHSAIAANENIIQLDYVNMGGKRANGSIIGYGEMSRAIIAHNTPTTAPGTLVGTRRHADGSWSAAEPLPGASGAREFAGGDRAVTAMPDGSLQYLAYGNDKHLHHNIRFANGTWQGWARVNNDATDKQLAGGPLALTATADGITHALAVDKDGNLLHTLRRPDGTWQDGGWAGVPGDGGRVFKAKDVAVTAMPNNTITVLAYGADRVMRITERWSNGLWNTSGWNTLPWGNDGSTFSGTDLAITSMTNHSVQIAAIGMDGNVWHMIRDARGVNSRWGAPEWAKGEPMRASGISIAALPDGSAQLLAIGADGIAWHTNRAANGVWTGFGRLNGSFGRPLSATGVGITALPDGRTYTLVGAR